MKRKEARKLLGIKKKHAGIFSNKLVIDALASSRPAIIGPMRSSACEGQPQAKAKPAQSAANLDSAPQNRKKPAPNLGEDQRLPTAGETIPIVFGKRTSGIGGVWVQPTLLKTGTIGFSTDFLYAISQGKIVSNPRRRFAWIGLNRIQYFANSNAITLAHIYETAATLAANPTTCPLTGGIIFCGIDIYSKMLPVAGVGDFYEDYYPAKASFGLGNTLVGIGNTGNLRLIADGAQAEAYRTDTGEDVTNEWRNSFLNISGEFDIASGPGGSAPIIRQPGDIVPIQSFFIIRNDWPGLYLNLDMPYGSFVIVRYPITKIIKIDPTLPDAGEIIGIQYEWMFSKSTTPFGASTTDNSSYADITFLKINGNICTKNSNVEGFSLQPKQLSIYYPQGVEVDLYSGGLVNGAYAKGASNQLVDLLMYMFTLYKRADGANTADIASPIFLDNMTAIAAFCNEYKLHFNGVVDEAINIIDFGVTMAPFFLLSFLSVGGQYRFEPVLPLTSNNQIDLTAITPVETFSEDNILPGTFTKSFRQAEERRPFVAVLLYRENNPSEVGIQRTVEVAFNNTPIDAPQEQFDMTDFCADANHAAIYGKYQLARRKHITHSISFDTALVLTDMKPTQIIKIERQRISSVGDNRAEVDFYQITDIAYNTDGSSTVEAEHFPLDSNDVAVISDEIVNGSFRVLL